MKERKNRNCNWKAIVSEAIHQHQHYYYDHHKDRQTIDLTQKVLRPNTDTNGTPVPRLGCCCVTVGITGEHFFVANTTKSLDERTRQQLNLSLGMQMIREQMATIIT